MVVFLLNSKTLFLTAVVSKPGLKKKNPITEYFRFIKMHNIVLGNLQKKGVIFFKEYQIEKKLLH